MIVLILTVILLGAYFLNKYLSRLNSFPDKKNLAISLDNKINNSLPIHYTYLFVIVSILAALVVFFAPVESRVKFGLIMLLILFNSFLVSKLHKAKMNAKNFLEKIGVSLLFASATIGIFIALAISVSIIFEVISFFKIINPFDFLFGLNWNPQDSNTDSNFAKSFGVIPVIVGSLMITAIAIFIAFPIGLMSVIYLNFYTKSSVRHIIKPIIEILAGIPTVVYGYFAATVVAPYFKILFGKFGIEVALESGIAAGFVIGIMIIPFVLSLIDDAVNAVPQGLKDAALALGSTKSEMIRTVILTYAAPSIVGAMILAVSRAIGETMIVVMAAGLTANLTINPLNSVTTATVQIATLLVGDQEFGGAKTLAAFALAFLLFLITFLLNVIALFVVKYYKRRF